MKKILLTGGSGNLGGAILKSGKFQNLLTPSHNELDITRKQQIKDFFQDNEIVMVVHCAAVSNMKGYKENPVKAIETNIIGTSNLVSEVKDKKIRFIHISTDGVYNRTKGSYSEKGETIPYDEYGWTKLGAECSVRTLRDYCIIRTSFFNPEKLNFSDSPTDVYSSKIPIDELVEAIRFLSENEFKGVINIGVPRISSYDLYKQFIPNLKQCKLNDLVDGLTENLPNDSSMDVSLWEKLKN